MSRVQPRDSLAMLVPQLPDAQVKSVRVRLCVPVSSQVPPMNPPQAPHIANVELPHELPSVLRVHEPVSVLTESPQLPPAHTRSVRVRERVPLSPHGSAKPPQEPHTPNVVPPHDVPSVDRVQPRSSVLELGWQTLATQA